MLTAMRLGAQQDMLVLHGIWMPADEPAEAGRFVVWGEADRPRRRRQKSPEYNAALHPFAATAAEIRGALHAGDKRAPAILKGARPTELALRLPTQGSVPQASPSFVGTQWTMNNGIPASAIDTWIVPGLALSITRAADWLLMSPRARDLKGLGGAPDLRFWGTAVRLGLELLARQRFLPALQEVRTAEMRLHWLPSLADPADYRRFVVLCEGLPPVCRSSKRVSDSGEERVAPGARAIVFDFLSRLVDGFLHTWLTERAAAERRRDTVPTHLSRAVEQWLTALDSGKDVFNGMPTEVEPLHNELMAWTTPAAGVVAGQKVWAPFRTCFRLEAPPESHLAAGAGAGPMPSWQLRYFLQATDDPSLLVPASAVWHESQDSLDYLNHRFDQPQERLLGDLGRAAQLFPPIDGSLRTSCPQVCSLTAGEAYSFLRESAPLFEESGFGVLVPSWWERRGARTQLGLKLRLRGSGPARASLLGRESLVGYDWQVALGDHTLSQSEFEALAKLKEPLVQVRGQWVELNPAQIEQAIHFWEKRRSQGEIRLAEAIRLALGQAEAAEGMPIVAVESEGWFHELIGDLCGADDKLEPIAPPAGFVGELRPYQARGLSWLASLQRWGLGACLADDMGLGKTIQLIGLLLLNKERASSVLNGKGAAGARERGGRDMGRDETLRPSLLICPTSVVGNWRRELARFAPELAVVIHHGAERLSGTEFAEAATASDLVVTTYGLAHRDEEMLVGMRWHSIVLDEAQNVKNPSAKQTQSVRRLDGVHRIALTGTPVENRLSELWSIMEFLNPGYLGSAERFRRRFAIAIERWQDRERAAELRNLVQPFVLRRLKSDTRIIQDLPEKVEVKEYCLLTREQATLYEAAVKEMLRQVEETDGIKRKGLVLATLARLKQICNHPSHFLADRGALASRSGKLARLEELLDEVLATGDKALIFTQFVEFGEQLQPYLRGRFGREVLFLHGGNPAKLRDRMVTRFQEEDGGPPVFLLSLKAGGVGLNLTRANHVFHYDRWWNPAVENQATDRVFRIGQHRGVEVHKFVCTGTLEERIDEMIDDKKTLAENVVGTGEGWLTEMSTAQLRDVFALRRSAIGDE